MFGQGTGATSVALHLMSPKSKDLFQRAIMQSGAASAPYQPRKAANESVQKLAAASNCPFDDNLLTCLRSKSAEEIIQLQSSISSKDAKALMELSNPVIDGDFLEESTQKLYEYHKKGKKPPYSLLQKLFPNVEIMTGFTTHESSLDVIQRPEDASQDGISRSSIVKTLKYGKIDNKIVDELVKYQYADHSDTKARYRTLESDFMTVAPMTFEAIALAEVFSVAIITNTLTHNPQTCQFRHRGIFRHRCGICTLPFSPLWVFSPQILNQTALLLSPEKLNKKNSNPARLSPRSKRSI